MRILLQTLTLSLNVTREKNLWHSCKQCSYRVMRLWFKHQPSVSSTCFAVCSSMWIYITEWCLRMEREWFPQRPHSWYSCCAFNTVSCHCTVYTYFCDANVVSRQTHVWSCKTSYLKVFYCICLLNDSTLNDMIRANCCLHLQVNVNSSAPRFCWNILRANRWLQDWWRLV